MHVDLGIFLLFICISLLIRINQGYPFRKYRAVSSYDTDLSFPNTEPIVFFQNEPVPLASSVVDDLTTLASIVYIVSFIVIIFILLAWITHYNAPCSSIITSILSSITGLPEPVIHSVALCGLCCIWCEKTWLFRRIHQFNIWASTTIKKFLSVTCKILYDTVCPCCQPPDTPSNRSIIGSLPASIIAMINIPDASEPSPPKASVRVVEPTSVTPRSFIITTDINTQPTNGSLVDNHVHLETNILPAETKINVHHIDETKSMRTKRRKRPRKQVQLKQRSAIEESSQIKEQIDQTSEDEEEDEEEEEDGEDEENIKLY